MADLDYVRVVGRFGIVVRDEATDDPNLEPDTIWCDSGSILFTPLVTAVKVIDANPVPVTLGQSTIEGEIDANGYLSLRGTREIQFVDLGSTKVNPYITAGKATHKVEFIDLQAGGNPVSLPSPVNVRLSADMVSPMGTIDLTLVSPVPVAGGTAQVVGPAGPSAYEGWLAQGNTGTFDDFMTAGFADNESYVSALTSAQNAANSATAALASQNAAATSATNAATSATTATTKAGEAATSATNAAGSATAANTSKNAAATSATNAATSETNALSSKNAAATSATNAATSATNASNSATAAATSASNASTSASTATTKASEASTSAATATTKANEASASASQAASAASGAVAVAVGGSLPQLYTNLVRNPSFEVNTADYAASGSSPATFSRVTTQSRFGSGSLEIVTNGGSVRQGVQNTAFPANMPPQSYTASCWVKGVTPGVKLSMQFVGNGVTHTGEEFVFTTGEWQRIVIRTTVLSTTNNVGFRIQTGDVSVATTFYVDGAMLLVGDTMPPYFDGSSPGCYWTGTANASTSVKMVTNRDDIDNFVRTDMSSVPVTNLVRNPSASSTNLWSGGTATIESLSQWALFGGSCIHATSTNPAAAANTFNIAAFTDSLVVGRQYTASFYVTPVSASATGLLVQLRVGSNSTSTSVALSNTVGRPTRINHTFTATATNHPISVWNANALTQNVTIALDGALLTEGIELRDYFDGDSKWSYWTGTPHASTSVYAPPQAEDLVLKRNVPVVYTNLITNPSFETGIQGWSFSQAIGSSDSAWSASGVSSLRITPSVAAQSDSWGGLSVNVAPNNPVTVSATIRLTAAHASSPGVLHERARTITLYFYNSSNVIVGTAPIRSQQAPNAAGATRLHVTAIAPDTTSYVALRFYNGSDQASESVWWDAVSVTQTSHPVDYFDGSSPGCEWTGTPHASTSIKRFKSKPIDLNNVPTYVENLFTNGGATYGTSPWIASGSATLSTGTEWSSSGSLSFKVTPTATNAGSGDMRVGGTNIMAFGVVVGKTYTVRAKLRLASPVGATGATGRSRRVMVFTSPPGLTPVFTDNFGPQAPDVPGVHTVQHTFTIPPGTGAVIIGFGGATTEAGLPSQWYDDLIMVEGTSIPEYFDGDTEGCYWTGTPGASTSVKKFPKRDDVVLTSRMPELARNLVINPGMEPSAIGYWVAPANVSKASNYNWGASSAPSLTVASTTTVTDSYVYQDIPVDSVSLQLGKTYTVSGTIQIPAPQTQSPDASRARTITAYWYNSGSIVSTAFITTPAPNVAGTYRLSKTFTVPTSGVTSLNLRLYNGGNAVSGPVHWDDVQITEGPPIEYFDGDSAGCRWLGEPYRSHSIRLLHTKQDYNLLTWLDAGRAQGVGSPEGVVTATVGTRYVDTAATNGARTWEKASGTGNTGWVVAEGDTGSRRIVAPGTIANAPNMEITVRRKGDVVTIHLTEPLTAGTISGSAILLGTLTAGFRPLTMPNTAVVAAPLTSNTGVQVGTVSVITSEIRAHGLVSGTRHYSTVTFVTGEPWPTTLPGTTI